MNIYDLPENFIHFASNHFELIVAVTLAWVSICVIAFLITLLTDVSLSNFLPKTLRSTLFIIAIGGQIFLISLIIPVVKTNYFQTKDLVVFPDDVQFNTRWVEDNSKIFYIQEDQMKTIRIDGSDEKTIFKAKEPIREYHFSPDGKTLLIATTKDLYMLILTNHQSHLIDSVGSLDEGLKGTISGIRWAPDSKKFCYELSRWSQYGAQDYLFVYDIRPGQKLAVNDPVRKLSSLYWDLEAEHLYYLFHQSRDVSDYIFRVYKIPLTTLKPQLVAEFPYEKSDVPMDSLELRGISLYLDSEKNSFGKFGKKDEIVSATGKRLGIDENDYLYYQPNRWFQKKLFKIPRKVPVEQVGRYAFNGGELTVYHFRWIPGGRYVILQHEYYGIMVLEPASGRLGQLAGITGKTYGWYTP